MLSILLPLNHSLDMPSIPSHRFDSQVVKALLVQSKLNIPFSGGLSSYSAFLLVLAAYDRCQNSDARNTFVTRGKGLASSPSGSNLYADGDSFSGGSVGGSIGGSAGSGLPVTEGEVFMHFLALFASNSQGFNSACQGIGESACLSPCLSLSVCKPFLPLLCCAAVHRHLLTP